MPFEPKIVRAAEPPLDPALAARIDDEFEASLPGDLDALACQLREDADRLSSLYPADINTGEGLVEPVARSAARRSVWTWATYASGAALLVAIAVALPWLLPHDDLRLSGGSPVVPAAPSHEPASGLARAQDNEGALQSAARSNETPALLLMNVSGPELEGLFDLWEADSVEQSRISI